MASIWDQAPRYESIGLTGSSSVSASDTEDDSLYSDVPLVDDDDAFLTPKAVKIIPKEVFVEIDEDDGAYFTSEAELDTISASTATRKLEPPDLDPYRPEIHGSHWNYDLQRSLAMPESVAKYARLRSVCESFLDTATVAGRQILMEFNIEIFNEMDAILQAVIYRRFVKDKATLNPAELKEAQELQARYERLDSRFSIKRAPVGGRAGGYKFIYQGILFKLAFNKIDPQKSTGIYPNDEHAMKSVNNELKAVRCLESADPRGFSLPLCAAIHYNGHVLFAEALLPIDHTTLVLGSDNGGRVVKSDSNHSAFREAVNVVASRYNLHPFYTRHLGAGKPLIHYFPLDVEGHFGHDKKNYLVDLARLMPPERAKNVYSRLLRPAFLLSGRVDEKLYSDTFSDKWMLKYTDEEGKPVTSESLETLKAAHEEAVKRIVDLIKVGEFLKEPPKFFPNQKIFDASSHSGFDSKVGGQSHLPESDASKFRRQSPFAAALDLEKFDILIFNLHAIGLNCRHLGQVLASISTALSLVQAKTIVPSSRVRNLQEARDLIGTECMARTFKNLIRHALRVAKELPDNGIWSKSVIQRTIVDEFRRYLLQKQENWLRFVKQIEARFEGFLASGFTFGWEIKELYEIAELQDSAGKKGRKGSDSKDKKEQPPARLWRLFMKRLSTLTKITFTKRIESDHKVVSWIDESDVIEIGVKSSTMLLLHSSNAKYSIAKFLEAHTYLKPDLDAAYSHVARSLDLIKEWRMAAPFDGIEPIYWTAIASLFLRRPSLAPEIENILSPIHQNLLAKRTESLKKSTDDSAPHLAVNFRDPNEFYVKKVECLRTLIELGSEVWDPILIAERKEWANVSVSSSSASVLDRSLSKSYFDADTAMLYAISVYFHPEELGEMKWGWWCYIVSSLHTQGNPPALNQERALMLLELFCKITPSCYKELQDRYFPRLETLIAALCERAFRLPDDERAAEIFHGLYVKMLESSNKKLPPNYEMKASFDGLFVGNPKFAEASFKTILSDISLKVDPENIAPLKFLKLLWLREKLLAKFIEKISNKGGDNLAKAVALVKAKLIVVLKDMPHWLKHLS